MCTGRIQAVTGTERAGVIVVGGGFAGVTAARELAHAGHQVVLLEAKDRLGGRTHSREWHGETVEIGGMWIHYLQPFVWSEITRAGLPVRHIDPAEVAWFNGGSGPTATTDADRQELAQAWEAYFEGARDALQDPHCLNGDNAALTAIDAQTMAERLDQLDLKPDVQARLSTGLTSWANGRIDQAGALFPHRLYAVCGFSAPAVDACTTDLILATGTGQLISEMANQADFDVRFDSTVMAVRSDGDLVRVELADGQSMQTRAVVIALPLNVIHTLDISPPLSTEPAAAVAARQISSGFKLLIKARAVDEQDKRIDAGGVGTVFAHVLTDRHFGDGSQLLVAFGPDAEQIADATLADVQAHLDALAPGLTVEDVLWHDWTTDPFAQGTWAVHAPRWVTEHKAALDNPSGNVFFAGSDFADGWVGHIDGAIESGIRTARHVQQLLGDSSRSLQTARKDVSS
jgi:monoamine oxidase